MEKEKEQLTKSEKKNEIAQKPIIKRRTLLKTLAGIPV